MKPPSQGYISQWEMAELVRDPWAAPNHYQFLKALEELHGQRTPWHSYFIPHYHGSEWNGGTDPSALLPPGTLMHNNYSQHRYVVIRVTGPWQYCNCTTGYHTPTAYVNCIEHSNLRRTADSIWKLYPEREHRTWQVWSLMLTTEENINPKLPINHQITKFWMNKVYLDANGRISVMNSEDFITVDGCLSHVAEQPSLF